MFNSSRDGNDSADVDEVSRRFQRNRPFQQQQQSRNNSFNTKPGNRQPNPPFNKPESPPCKFCVRTHQWGRQYCPAWGKKCGACSIKNHLPGSQICKKNKNIRIVNILDYSDEDEGDDNDVNFLFLGQVETVSNSESDEYEDEEDEFFSCCEELSDEEKSASRRKEKKRGNRKASKFNGTKESSDEEEDLDALLCPLAP